MTAAFYKPVTHPAPHPLPRYTYILLPGEIQMLALCSQGCSTKCPRLPSRLTIGRTEPPSTEIVPIMQNCLAIIDACPHVFRVNA